MKNEIDFTFIEKTRIVDKNASFILIGNNIDGRVNFEFKEFENYSELEKELENILLSIEGEGEWNVSLYQVYKPYKIGRKYGY